MTASQAMEEALRRATPDRQHQSDEAFRASMRYRHALGGWYAKTFAAAREGKVFDRARPEPEDFPTAR